MGGEKSPFYNIEEFMTVTAIREQMIERNLNLSEFNPLPKDKVKRAEELEKRMKDDMKKFKCRFIDLQQTDGGAIQYSLKVYPNQPTIRQKLLSGKFYELTKMEIKHLMSRTFAVYDYVIDPVSGFPQHKKVGTKQRFSIEILPEGL